MKSTTIQGHYIARYVPEIPMLLEYAEDVQYARVRNLRRFVNGSSLGCFAYPFQRTTLV